MPVKILHPHPRAQHPLNLLIAQGTCDDVAKIDGVLVHLTTGQTIAAVQLLTDEPTQWGYVYKHLADGDYKFTLEQRNSPVVTEVVEFSVKQVQSPRPLSPGPPPVVTSPTNGAAVAVAFYPYGTSTVDITGIVFFNAANSTNGVVTQQPDNNGNWIGKVSGIKNWPNGVGNLYQLNVSNGNGTTPVNNLTISA